MNCAWAAAVLLVGVTSAAHAQTDYHNTDRARPLQVEDAVPVELRALEFQLGSGFAHLSGIGNTGDLSAELAWGLLPNTHLSLGASGGAEPGGTSGLRSVSFSLFHQLVSERGPLPAIALRIGGDVPGTLGATQTRGDVQMILTRTLGTFRLHATGAMGFGKDDAASSVPRWWYGAAIDRTLFRSSVLAGGEVTVAQPAGPGPALVTARIGARVQVSPTTVFDAGIARSLRSATGPAIALTLGVTRTFATAGHGTSGRAAPMYAPGGFNWRFRDAYVDAARLFNAFDYGHAVLYETLWADPTPDSALARAFTYLTTDLLVGPPRFAIAEDAIAPAYIRMARRAQVTFEWAHTLHRQIYDAYADDRLSVAAKDSLIERLTDAYFRDVRYALAAEPKAMALMDGAPYSGVFKRRYATFNGLIWAYHWLQVGLYESLIAGADPAQRHANVAAALARFRAMLASPPRSMPSAMPMTSAIAPAFTARHPRAAAVFDNLHMLHDIISDILASDIVPRARKSAAIDAALDEFQRADRNVMTREEWAMMGAMMGLDAMGGSVPRGP